MTAAAKAAKAAHIEPWWMVADRLYRVNVPGGWIYRTDDFTGQPVALVFVPWPPVEVMFAPPVGGGPA
jgi:hypothetical protein